MYVIGDPGIHITTSDKRSAHTGHSCGGRDVNMLGTIHSASAVQLEPSKKLHIALHIKFASAIHIAEARPTDTHVANAPQTT